MSKGFITLHRKIMDSPFYGSPDHIALWLHMLLKACHKDQKVRMGNQIISVKRGQFIAGRKSLSAETGVQESKVKRIIDIFKTEQQLEQQAFSKFSLFSIVNYDSYQTPEHQNKQEMNSKRTASEQQVNTYNNVNNENNEKRGAKAHPVTGFVKPTLSEVIKFATEKKINMDCQSFHDHFESNGWKVSGKTPMKNWQAAMRQWAKRDFGGNNKKTGGLQW